MNAHPPVITCRALAKSYGRRRALAGVDLDVPEGTVFGFLGPNGAGKTTAIRILLDLVRRDSGEVAVLGADPRSGGVRLRRDVGYLPGELPLAARRPARDLLAFLGRLRGGVPRGEVERLAERLHLDLDRPLRGLSKGDRQKVGLVQAFMHRPRLLVLDEPTSGLDPLLRQEFLDMVREVRAEGRTVFMSSHVLSEVQDVADRAAVIRAGRIAALEDMDDLRERALRRVTLTFAEPVGAAEFAALEHVRDAAVDGATLTCTVEGSPDALVKQAARHTVLGLTSEEPDLEELFFTHYTEGGAARGAEAGDAGA
ncbi:ABC transporter ATP-binding protein [Streptomonospora nanhaiensis]|uniref:ABC-2 type transport system ATP-binding protein n=1 Tax=Streptomonospora nanhaiensis TaxID=1323731 RepID=A0A853BRQ7_9ACTN|nr:ABC transporter ATP-binding protein [Streptomonospora nanhaiensis]MBV2362575.1 ABC transporter ATP-binding protein [Streptomonospora nanhaiensis]MBX9386855.1 ABC transporter ATP-binding protein [Streptomonospora nanhaiensis]NYI98078.1 ABC-2 type transport system ATP-binding protein [Streptomonospora nanhaiensis]